MLSLASNPSCIIMDDELNILPTSSRVTEIQPIERDESGAPFVPAQKTAGELKELVGSLQDTMVRISNAMTKFGLEIRPMGCLFHHRAHIFRIVPIQHSKPTTGALTSYVCSLQELW